MNEELHNIDDLFRRGIEGHEEAVPPSVWDAVNNNLDKKQASYYKAKYYRLKRAGLLLLLLCFLGGYLVYEGLKKPDAPALEKRETGIITPPNALPQVEKETDNAATTPNSKSTQERPGAAIQTDRPLNEKSFDSTNRRPSIANQSDNGVNKPEEKRSNDASSVVFTSPKRPVPTKHFSVAATAPLKKKTRPENNLYASTQSVSKTPLALSPYLRRIPLAIRDYSTPFIQLQTGNVTRKAILPTTAPPSPAKAKESNAHSLSLTAFAAPNVRFNRLEDDHRLAGPGRDRREARRQEQDAFSITGGLLLNYGLLKNLRIQSGVTVTSSSTTIDAKTVYARRDNSGRTRYELYCSSGYVYLASRDGVQPAVGDSAKTSGTTSSITYVGIPVSINYRLGSGKFSFYPGIGAGLNLLAGSNATTNLSGAATNEKATSSISGLKPAYLDGHIGLGVEYNLNGKLSIGLRPNARLALTPINKETPVKSYQNFLSVETGVRIKF